MVCKSTQEIIIDLLRPLVEDVVGVEGSVREVDTHATSGWADVRAVNIGTNAHRGKDGHDLVDGSTYNGVGVGTVVRSKGNRVQVGHTGTEAGILLVGSIAGTLGLSESRISVDGGANLFNLSLLDGGVSGIQNVSQVQDGEINGTHSIGVVKVEESGLGQVVGGGGPTSGRSEFNVDSHGDNVFISLQVNKVDIADVSGGSEGKEVLLKNDSVEVSNGGHSANGIGIEQIINGKSSGGDQNGSNTNQVFVDIHNNLQKHLFAFGFDGESGRLDIINAIGWSIPVDGFGSVASTGGSDGGISIKSVGAKALAKAVAATCYIVIVVTNSLTLPLGSTGIGSTVISKRTEDKGSEDK
jgi:hypothetical protein